MVTTLKKIKEIILNFLINFKIKSKIKKAATEAIAFTPLLLILLLALTQSLQIDINNYKNQKINLDFHEYFFESVISENSLILIVNKKPENITVFCGDKEIKDVIFYTNAIGYKAELYEKECLKEIMIKKEGEILYYKKFIR